MMFTAFNTEGDSSSRCSTASPSVDNLTYYASPAESYSSMSSPQSQDFSDLTASCASFVPSVTAISTSPDLQWMVQPLISSVAPSHKAPPYRPSPAYSRPAMRSAASKAHNSIKRGRAEQSTPEEDDKKRVRRERNKQAAAKCRNRRRELTDTLQAETDELEDEKSNLQNDIAKLLKERERLEFILAAHQPVCKIPSDLDTDFPLVSVPPCLATEASSRRQTTAQDASSNASPPPTFTSTSNSIFSTATSNGVVKMTDLDTSVLEESLDLLTKTETETVRSVPEVDLSNSIYTTQDWEPLHTPLCNSDFERLCMPVATSSPACTTFTSSFMFTFPEAETFPTCGIAHRRGSNSNDHSSDSLSSPTLLAL
ncbi:v-fos FBJ murine osteosarcoma viral oncogene homolog Ab [Brachionichthys hirsutus]|uniref:v-fos FBJ murine osteosarcoma viral oncogene homolog Ab n=1 Tax=Brachionichthys hirsutus TaxID=412623 RepID=UPI003604A4A5